MKKAVILIALALFLSTGIALAEQVNLNTATKAELVELPGIGGTKAEAIVAYRETHEDFKTLADLNAVEGIGDATVAGLKGKATTGNSE